MANGLLKGLNKIDCKTVGYAVDKEIVISGKFGDDVGCSKFCLMISAIERAVG